MKTEDIKKGDIVYIWEKFGQSIIEAEIVGEPKEDEKHGTIFDVHMLNIVDKNGKQVMSFGGNSSRRPQDIFKTPMEVDKYITDKEEQIYQGCLSEIKNIYDLIEFPLTHNFGECNENTSEVRAYKTKAKELLGVEIV